MILKQGQYRRLLAFWPRLAVDAFLLHMHIQLGRLFVHCCGNRPKAQLTANLWLTSWLFQTDFYRNVVTVGGGGKVGGGMQMDAGRGANGHTMTG